MADISDSGTAQFSWTLCDGPLCGTITQDDVIVTNGLITAFASSGCNVFVEVAPTGRRRSSTNARAPEAGSVCVFGICATFLTSASAAGGPHLVGLNGAAFEFDGEIGNVYNLVSSSGVSLNTLIGPYSTEIALAEAGTWMTALCLSISQEVSGAVGGVRVRLRAGSGRYNDSPSLEVFNGTSAMPVLFGESADVTKRPNTHRMQVSDAVHVAWSAVEGDATEFGAAFRGRTIRIVDVWIREQYVVRMFALEDGMHNGHWVTLPHRYLDVRVTPLRVGARAEGVLGRTFGLGAGEVPVVTALDEAMLKVPSAEVCDTDFALSRF